MGVLVFVRVCVSVLSVSPCRSEAFLVCAFYVSSICRGVFVGGFACVCLSVVMFSVVVV